MYLRFLGQAPPVYVVTLANQEAMRAAVEAAYFALPADQRPNWASILTVPDVVKAGSWFRDPTTNLYYRGNGPFNYAYETMPPVIAGMGTTVYLTDAEAAAWIAKVEASRQPLYGSPITLPERIGWTEPLSEAELSALITNALGPNANVSIFLASFPSLADAAAWLQTASSADIQARAAALFPPPPPVVLPMIPPPPPPAPAPPPYVPPSAPAPPPAIDYVSPDTGNVAPVGTTPAGHRYPILPYAPHPGTPMLIQSGWTPEEIGFWFANAFGGNLALTEAFLLSFSGREALGAWIQGKTPADVYARADAALAARLAPRVGTIPPAIDYAPPDMGGGGISLPMIALAGAALFYMTRK
jgi:hypothetical protein